MASSTGNNSEPLRMFLNDVLAAERRSETNLHAFAQEGDDNEASELFLQGAQQASLRANVLASELGWQSNDGGWVPAVPPSEPLFPRIPEEQILQNLIAAFAASGGKSALYECLAATSAASADDRTALLARQYQTEEQSLSARLLKLIPSRSKIAFNMLTVQEVDPAVETRMADDRITS